MRKKKHRVTSEGLITEYTGTSIQVDDEGLEIMTEEALQEALLKDSQNSDKEVAK